VRKTLLDYESHPAPIDKWANEAFWQGVHGGARATEDNLVPAHYVLFCDGTGTFLPALGRALVLPDSGRLSGESDLRLVRVEDISEGDLVVLRVGHSGALLDEASDRIMGCAGEQGLNEDATDWKSALDALLVTHSYEEVAEAMRERGAHATATSVRHWAGVEALGPGSEHVFEVLIGVLGEKGKIISPFHDWKAHAADRWSKLRELRNVRQKAGSAIRQDLMEALRVTFASTDVVTADKTSIQLEGGGKTELLILRVSSLDQIPAYVQPSRLLQIDDLRGNKWLG
jgi:hypothetical protein